MDETRHWLELDLIPGIGSKTFFRLLDYFGSVKNALEASEAALLQAPGIKPALAENIARGCKAELDKSLKLIEKYDVTVVTFQESDYPERLKHIHDPPPLLYVRGTLLPGDANAVSVVGSRRATPYGKMVAGRLSGDLARRGITVVSGLAYGIDSAAHKGAIAAGGRTLAILGCGVDVIYPRPNAKLYEEIIGAGAVISEFPMGRQPEAGLFPMRNRIVSGLSLGTLVVEAPRKSGSLITANHALEQGREVFAAPGNIFSPYSEGCHKLIKEGAKLVENVYDIIDEIEEGLEGIEPAAMEETTEETQKTTVIMSDDEKKVFNLLSMAPTHIDEITEECRLTASQTSSALMTLELKGLAEQLPGKNFIRRG